MLPLLAQQEAGGLQQTIDSLARTPLSQIVVFVGICSLIRLSLYGYIKNTIPHHRHGLYTFGKFINEAMDAIVYAGVFVFMIIRPFAVQAFLIPSGSMLQTLYLNDFIVANKAIYRYTDPKVDDIIVFKPPDRALNQGQHDIDFIKRCQGVPGDVVQVIDGKLWRNHQPVDEPYLSNSGRRDADANGHPEDLGKDVKIDTDWKLIYYQGRARPDLYGHYVSVQIRRADEPRFNYGDVDGKGAMMICHEFAVAAADEGSGDSPVRSWKNPFNMAQADRQYEKELEEAPPAAVPKGFVLMMGDNRNYSYDGRAWGLVPRDDVIGRAEFIWMPVGRWRVTR